MAIAVVASLLRSAGPEIGGGGFLDGGGVKGDDCAVAETGAFTEGCWS